MTHRGFRSIRSGPKHAYAQQSMFHERFKGLQIFLVICVISHSVRVFRNHQKSTKPFNKENQTFYINHEINQPEKTNEIESTCKETHSHTPSTPTAPSGGPSFLSFSNGHKNSIVRHFLTFSNDSSCIAHPLSYTYTESSFVICQHTDITPILLNRRNTKYVRRRQSDNSRYI